MAGLEAAVHSGPPHESHIACLISHWAPLLLFPPLPQLTLAAYSHFCSTCTHRLRTYSCPVVAGDVSGCQSGMATGRCMSTPRPILFTLPLPVRAAQNPEGEDRWQLATGSTTDRGWNHVTPLN